MMAVVAQALVGCVMLTVGALLVALLDGLVFGQPRGTVGALVGMVKSLGHAAPLPPRADPVTLAVAPLLALIPSLAMSTNLPWRGSSDAPDVSVLLLCALPSLSVAVVPLVGLAGAVKPTLLDALAVALSRLLLWSVWVGAIIMVLCSGVGLRVSMAELMAERPLGIAEQPLAALASLAAIALWEAVERRPRGFIPSWFAGTSGAIRAGLRVARAAERWVLCAMWVVVFCAPPSTTMLAVLGQVMTTAAVVVVTAIIGRILSPRRIEHCVWTTVVVLWPLVLIDALLPLLLLRFR
jgi:NADH dehydrogenase